MCMYDGVVPPLEDQNWASGLCGPPGSLSQAFIEYFATISWYSTLTLVSKMYASFAYSIAYGSSCFQNVLVLLHFLPAMSVLRLCLPKHEHSHRSISFLPITGAFKSSKIMMMKGPDHTASHVLPKGSHPCHGFHGPFWQEPSA